MDDLHRIVTGLQDLGPYGLFVLFIISLFREWVVIGPTYQREVKRSTYYQNLAEQGVGTARRAVDLAVEKLP